MGGFIKVDRHKLREFKSIVEKNRQQFGEIRQKLSGDLNKLRSTDYKSEAADHFAEIFKKSEGDIQKLEGVMQEFVKQLDKTCNNADKIAMHKYKG